MDKDRYKSAFTKKTKGKAPPPSNLWALGKQVSARTSSSDADSTTSRKFTSSPLSDRKREATSKHPSSSVSATKKPKLLSQTFTPLGRSLDERKASPATRQFPYEEVAIDVESDIFVKEVMMADSHDNEERVEGLLCGAVKQLRASRYKPDNCLFLGLMYLAKTKPALFTNDLVTEGFLHLLKREVAMTFKSKGNPAVPVLACNVLMLAYANEGIWPDLFVKVYAEDSLGDRLWVDRKECQLFVKNILTAFDTKMPREECLMSAPDATKTGDQSESASPVTTLADDDENTVDADVIIMDPKGDDTNEADVEPRFGYQKSAIELYILELLSDQLSRRGNMDVSVRNLIRLMMVTCCYSEVRLMVAQRLEMWLMNNAKLNKCAQDLLMTVCMNCDQNDKKDTEVIIQLLKIRLKTKPLINHYILSMKELVSQNTGNLQTILTHTIYNELSNARNPNNMVILQALFQNSSDAASTILADIFQDLLCNRDDYLRALRALLREIVRTMRPDINFILFCRGIMGNRTEKKFQDMEDAFKERYILSIADLVTLCMLLGVTTQVREAHTAILKGEHKDVEVLVKYQEQVAQIQRDCVWWLHLSVPVQCELKPSEYLHCLHKVLFMETIDHYHNKDNWPPENDRGVMLHVASEAPVLEDTLIRVMIIGLNSSLAISPTDALEICDQLVRRTVSVHLEGRLMLKIERVEIIDALFNLSKYNHPDNIELPKGYTPPDLAISAHYWKAWTILLVITAYNPQVFGQLLWKNYDARNFETLKCLIEMVITNNYKFPPPTLSSDDKVLEEIKNKERMVSEEEKHMILQFECHLAAATTKVTITEQNSLLLTTLIGLNPNGIARRPPPQVLEQIKCLSASLHVRQLLCSSRDPDYLLDIIQRQGTSQSMPWLANLVESSEGSFDVLPVQCLCEFLLMEQTSTDDDNDSIIAKKAAKQEALLRRMQTLVRMPETDGTMSTELLNYFLCRLSSPQALCRHQATKGLSMVLETAIVNTTDDDSSVVPLFSHHRWLLSCLPSLPIFTRVRDDTSTALRKALQVETRPSLIASYIVFLARHTSHLGLHELSDVVLDLSRLIVERTTIMSFLLPMDHDKQSPMSDAILSAFVTIYMGYIRQAQQPDQTYTWSNIQDQIMLQWQSGVSATMRVLVVHAMVLLLTYPHRGEEYDDLLNTWFPINQPLPSAFLLDTSEEALLLPDWLKLRMIRSSSERVVNAALQDIEPAQLLLFVQSFGIPVSSMSQLLRCLDDMSSSDTEALRACIVDTAYMLQLVEIQRSRGATGGTLFARFLGSDVPVNKEKGGMMDENAENIRDIWVTTTHSETLCLPSPETLPALIDHLLQLVTCSAGISYRDMYRTLQKTTGVADSTQLRVLMVAAMNSILTSGQREVFLQRLETNVDISTKLLHLLCRTTEISEDVELMRLMQAIRDGCTDNGSYLYSQVNKYCSKVTTKVIVEKIPDLDSLDEATSDFQTMVLRNDPKLERTLWKFMSRHMRRGDVSQATRLACSVLHSTSQNDMLSHLFTDWLELLDPEVVTCVPEFQREILFGKDRTGGEKAEIKNGTSGIPQVYLLSLLTHHASWVTLRACIDVLLQEHTKYNAGAVLDFICACYHNPKIWQGQEKAKRMSSTVEDVFNFTAKQLQAIVEYVICEAELISQTKSVSAKSCDPASTTPNTGRAQSLSLTFTRRALCQVPSDVQSSKRIRDRVELLKWCIADREEKLKVIVNYVQTNLTLGRHKPSSYLHLLTELYIQWPYLLCWLNDANILSASENVSTHSNTSQIDAISHRLITSLTHAVPGKQAEARMYDANIASRKLASQHPLLFLRQLPMLSALLKARTGYSIAEMRHRKFLQLFTHVLGLFELLEPHIFKSHIVGLEDSLEVYFDLFRVHGMEQRTLSMMIAKFVGFLHHFLDYCPQRAATILHKYVPILSDISLLYPDISPLKSVMAALTLPHNNEDASDESDLTPDHDTVRPSSPWTVSVLAPFHKKLQKSSTCQDILEVLRELDETSKRKVNILSHFLDDLKQLMVMKNEQCRSLAHNLAMRYVRHCPSIATAILPVFLHCLTSTDVAILSCALNNIAEFTGLCQEHAPVLLKHAFMAGLVQSTDATTAIADTFHILNTST